MELFQIFGRIALNGVDDVNRDLNDTTDKAEGSSNKIVSAFKKIGAAVATYFAVDKIVAFGKACVDAAVEVAAEEAAFTQIMGEYSDQAQKKINEIADATGITESRMTPYMTSMTAKFKGLGYGTEEATDMASTGLTLAADAAAFWDKSLDDSMSSLNSFINGNYEGGEAIGLFANETTLATWAADNLGLSWKDLSEKEKQFARLEFAKAMQKASGVTGQASREADAYANVQGNLTEAWRQFKAVIGEPILENIVIPAMLKLTELLETMAEKIKSAIEWVKKNQDTIKKWGLVLASVASGVAAFLIVMNWNSIMNAASTAVSTLTTTIKKMGTAIVSNPIGLLIGIITALIPYIVNLYKTNEEFAAKVDAAWAQVKSVLLGVWEAISPIFQKSVSWIRDTIIPAIKAFISNLDLFGAASEAGGSIFQTAMTVISTALNWLSGLWNSIFPMLQSVFATVMEAVMSALTALSEIWSALWPEMQRIAESLFEALESAWTTVGEPVFGFLQSVVQALLGAWEIIWPSLSNLVSVAFDVISTVWNEIGAPVFDLIRTVVEDVIGFVGQFFCDNFNTMGETSNSVLTTLAMVVAGVFNIIALLWENVLKPVLQAIGDFITNVLKPAWDAVFPVLQEIVQTCFDGIIDLWNNSLKPILDGIIQFLTGIFSGDWSQAWEGIKEIANGVWEGIKTIISTAIGIVSAVVNAVIAFIQENWDTIWSAISETAKSIWDTIKQTVTDAVSKVQEKISSVFGAVRQFIENTWDKISSAIETAWNTIKQTVTDAISKVQSKISSIFGAVRTFIENTWNKISGTITTVWNTIKQTVTDAVSKVQSKISSVFGAVKQFVENTWNKIKSSIVDPISDAYQTVSTKVGDIFDDVSSVFNSAKSTVETIWNDIQSAIETPIENAKTFVGNMIDNIKGFFNFEWSLPQLKLPHVSITGSFSLAPPSVPHFSIEWYKKGGILEAPTIFSMNPKTGKAMGGGEAGPEAVAPIDTLLGYVRTAVAEQNAAQMEKVNDRLEEMLNVAREMLIALQAGQQIVLNNREVARTVREYA